MNTINFSSAVGAALCLLVGLSPSLGQETAATPYGYWMNPNGWVIEAAPCGDEICGHVVGVGGRSAASQRHDVHNPDPALRTRPLCGIAIFGAFVPNGETDEWEDGWIYNPRDGKTYSSNMSLAENGNLELRGYVLSPLLGRTIALTPSEKPAEPCDPAIPAPAESASPN